jgi:hypothetical protein
MTVLIQPPPFDICSKKDNERAVLLVGYHHPSDIKSDCYLHTVTL